MSNFWGACAKSYSLIYESISNFAKKVSVPMKPRGAHSGDRLHALEPYRVPKFIVFYGLPGILGPLIVPRESYFRGINYGSSNSFLIESVLLFYVENVLIPTLRVLVQ